MFENEKIIECGTVIKKNGSTAKLVIMKNDACDSCGSMFCNINKNQVTVEAENTENAKVGDVVQVAIGGNEILGLSFMVYGLPIIIAIGMIIAGLQIFDSLPEKELISVGLAVASCVAYFLIFGMINKSKKDNPRLPKIIKILKPEDIVKNEK